MSAIDDCIKELNKAGLRHAVADAERLERVARHFDNRASLMEREGWHAYAVTCERATANRLRWRAARFRTISAMGDAL